MRRVIVHFFFFTDALLKVYLYDLAGLWKVASENMWYLHSSLRCSGCFIDRSPFVANGRVNLGGCNRRCRCD